MDSTADFDRGTVTDTALALFLARGFGSTTLDDIAEASGVAVETVSRVFPTRESFVLDVVDDMLAAAVKHLPEGEQDEDLVDALSRAHKEMLGGIIAGTGAVPLQRMQQMGLLAMASPTLAAAISERRKQTLPLALAEHYGMDPDDPLILRTVRVWSAVVSGTYAAGISDSADTEPARDLDDTRRMTRRLDHAFKHITGRSEF
ncbi:TetR/AcrR family transcriptional regulator [Mycolicibacterium sphagni]|uniref:TetR family transcriptional regulator n=1 Tax=Mycolicibacterium sphagni TaxID=1786 RepID=A0ABX2JR90_9MYCO|nr:TetR/AcrR family transcriptional regulator [Mycolicibacterium sphagni]NTY60086.1 TetR family transcriptional regulator [Mycolicibacterium sphagni]